MDLRMIKTRRQIKKAFLKLREKMMPEKIKVKDICEMAMINKTTFYNHYTDSMQLSDEIDNSAIDSVMSSLPHGYQYSEDPEGHIEGILNALDREAENLKLIFRGKQEIFCAKLEERLCRVYGRNVTDPEDKMCMSFVIGGFVRIIKDYIFSDSKYSVDRIVKSSAALIKTFTKRSKQTAADGVN